MKSHFSTAIATAAAAGLMGAVACGGSSTPEPETPEAPAAEAPSEAASPPQGDAEKHTVADAKDCCKGMNDCKGKGGVRRRRQERLPGAERVQGSGWLQPPLPWEMRSVPCWSTFR